MTLETRLTALATRAGAEAKKLRLETASSLTTAKSYADGLNNSTVVDLVSAIKAPMVMAHRGGMHVYPEQSMDGFDAAARSGFYPEMDIQFLKDGTPVLCHDATVDRTMTGATGDVSSLTRDQWRQARINPVYKGGDSAQPLFFSDVLARFGGNTVIVPEVKSGATTAQVQSVIDMVKSRRLQKAVVMQSFDYTAVKQMVAAGLECVYLMNDTIPSGQTVTTIWNDGIRWVGPSKNMSASTVNSLVSKGFKVVPYSTDSKAQADALPAGVFGYFSNDPWAHSGQLQAEGVPRWRVGSGWPAKSNIRQRSTADPAGTGTEWWSGGPEITGSGLYFPADANSSLFTVGLEHLTGGQITRPLTMRLTFQFLRRVTTTEAANVGFTLWRNSGATPFTDAATSGQDGFTFALRRNGAINGWHYTNGAAASALPSNSGSATGAALTAADTPSGQITLNLEMSGAWIGVYCPTNGAKLITSNSLGGSFTPALRVAQTECIITDVHVGPWIA